MSIRKAMISQPMANLSEIQIVKARNDAIKLLEELDYKVINTYFTDEWYSQDSMTARGVVQVPVCFLAKSIENMSLCDTVYFAKGWELTRGCKIEHDIALAYGMHLIYA